MGLSHIALGLYFVASFLVGSILAADVLMSVSSPKVQTPDGKGLEFFGYETFNSLSEQRYRIFTTQFNQSTDIINGQYSNLNIKAASKDGGADGTGMYPYVADASDECLLSLSTPGCGTDGQLQLTYFGMWVSCLDDGLYIEFFKDLKAIFTLTKLRLDPLITDAAYYGNPNYSEEEGNDKNCKYFYLNLHFQDQTFDQVLFSAALGSGTPTRTDNHAIGGYFPTTTTTTTTTTASATKSTTTALTTTSTQTPTTTRTINVQNSAAHSNVVGLTTIIIIFIIASFFILL